LRKFMVYLDADDICMKVAVPAKDEADAREYVHGNGDIVSVKDVSDEYRIRADKVSSALGKDGFNRKEIDFIIRTLTRTNIAD